MSFSKSVLDFVAEAAHGVSATETAKRFKKTTTQAAVALNDHWKAGRLKRKKTYVESINMTVWVYSIPTQSIEISKKTPPVLPEQPAVATPMPSSLDSLVQDFASAFAARIVEIAVPMVKAELAKQLGDTLPKTLTEVVVEAAKEVAPAYEPPAPAAQKSHKKKILVCGLLPAQAGFISKEFHIWFDLDFATSDMAGRSLRSKIEAADAVFTMANFISHHTQEAVSNHDRAKLHIVHGGMTSLREKLATQIPK